MTRSLDLTGRRILVVEDETVIAFLIEEILQEAGCVVVGPIGRLGEAVLAARDAALDAAILDVTIRGGPVYPVAECLLARFVPFALASGYGDWALPARFRDQPRLTKPFTGQELIAQVQALCGESDISSPAGLSLA